jgi:hypothetical protein
VDRWQAQERPLLGAFIHGSSARRRALAPGSDLDLCMVVPTAPDPAWFEEYSLDDVVLEIVPLDIAALADPDAVLADPVLPFNLCEGIVIADPAGVLHNLQTHLAPNLVAVQYRRQRAETCHDRALAAFETAQKALRDNEIASVQFALTIGLWHTLGLDSAIAGRCPTNRRGFVYLESDALEWECPELTTLARQALGCAGLTAQDARALADAAGLIKDRYRRGILAMVELGEIEPAAWPLLHAALWRSAGATPHPGAQARILAALGYASLPALRQRYEAASRLLAVLRQRAQLLSIR